MIEYAVLIKGIDESFIEIGTIKGKNKRELALQLNKLCHAHNIDLKSDTIKLKLKTPNFDKLENL